MKAQKPQDRPGGASQETNVVARVATGDKAGAGSPRAGSPNKSGGRRPARSRPPHRRRTPTQVELVCIALAVVGVALALAGLGVEWGMSLALGWFLRDSCRW